MPACSSTRTRFHGGRPANNQIVAAAKHMDLAIEQTGLYCVRLGNRSSVIEVEVCRIRRFNKVHGLRFKRMTGSSESYKNLCELLLSVVRL